MRKLFSFSSLARVITAGLLVVAIDDLPRDYYTVLRWVTCGLAAYCWAHAMDARKKRWGWTFGIVALVFNPIQPPEFSKDLWALVDVITATLFLASIPFVQHQPERLLEMPPTPQERHNPPEPLSTNGKFIAAEPQAKVGGSVGNCGDQYRDCEGGKPRQNQ